MLDKTAVVQDKNMPNKGNSVFRQQNFGTYTILSKCYTGECTLRTELYYVSKQNILKHMVENCLVENLLQINQNNVWIEEVFYALRTEKLMVPKKTIRQQIIQIINVHISKPSLHVYLR